MANAQAANDFPGVDIDGVHTVRHSRLPDSRFCERGGTGDACGLVVSRKNGGTDERSDRPLGQTPPFSVNRGRGARDVRERTMALESVTSRERRGAAHLMRWLADMGDAWRSWFEGKAGTA